ncbi:MAG: hypothetical protein A4E53_03014 [Pelotomaculum sp. PtaB.Bin104]|nr:MAG: hypothetical protein A4E53_03014 [Pelotomaculum sp. PtaB.Bin104]
MSTVNLLQKEPSQGGAGAVNEVLLALPANIRSMLTALPFSWQEKVEEIRLRQGRPLLIGLANEDVFLRADGRPTHRFEEAYQVTPLDMERVVQLISGSSLYALEEEFRNGFITLPGGHRAGITGKAVLEGGKVRTLKYISGCNIRISREISGAASAILPYMLNGEGGIFHTVIVSPPCCGKTTMLRDLIRQVSNGVPELGFTGLTVGVVDERSEIAGCYKGIPQRDVGLRTDVLDGCPKAEGMMMLLRAMGPRVIAADEIGRNEDVQALEEVLNAGVKLIITAHGKSLAELLERPALGKIIKSKMLERFVILSRSRGVGTLEEVIDGKLMRPIEVRKC